MQTRKRGRREVAGNDLKYRIITTARHKLYSGGTFAEVLHSLLDDPNLGGQHRQLYRVLALEAKQVPGTLRYETRKLSLRWLAARLRTTPSAVSYRAKRLAQLGWIRRERAVGRGTGYALPRHPEPEQTAASEPPAAVGVGPLLLKWELYT